MNESLRSWTGDARPASWAAFYVRVTQEESVKADLSVPNQIARAREVAAARGWTNWRIYVEPRHVSGELWLEKRAALRELVTDVQAGKVTAVCARHTDRLWRTSDIQGRLLAILRQHSVELWDFSVRHEYKTAHGRFSLQVLGAAAELEVNLTAERIREMKRGKARKGKTGGGPPPFGYTSQSRRILELEAAGLTPDEAYAKACLEFPVGKRWYVDDDEAHVVRLIFSLYTDPKGNIGARRITRHLNQQGYKSRMGLQWLANYVMRLINNPVYAGFTSYDEKAYEQKVAPTLPRSRQELYKGEHEPLISPEVWKRAQELREEALAVKKRGRSSGPKRVFALTGILRCPGCGSRMIGKWSSHSARSYYICARRHNGGPELCTFTPLDADQLHGKVWDWVHTIVSSPDYVVDHLARLQRRLDEGRPDAEKALSRANKRIEDVKAALGKYFALFESSRGSPDQVFVERVRSLQTELQTLEEEAAHLSAQAQPPRDRKVTREQVERLMADLKSRALDRPEVQKALFLEMKRRHGFMVRAKSSHEVVVSIALPDFAAEIQTSEAGNLTNAVDRRLYSVVGTANPSPVGLCSQACPSRGTQTHVYPLEETLVLSRAYQTAREWALIEMARGRLCECGCREPVRVAARHRRVGIPRFILGHHPKPLTRDVQAIRANGGMTAKDAARELGIGATTLRRLEGVVYATPPRVGGRKIRMFRSGDLEAVRLWLSARRLGEAVGATSVALGRSTWPTRETIPRPRRKHVEELLAVGGLSPAEVARSLRVSVSTLQRLEGVAYPTLPRFGPYRARLFRPADLDRVREWFASRSTLTMRAVAAQLGMGVNTLRLLEGTVYPKRPRIGSRAAMGFRSADVEAVRDWMKARARGEAAPASTIASGSSSWPMPDKAAPRTRKDVADLRSTGGLTSTDLARSLGIDVQRLLALEGVAYAPPTRFGPQRIRSFTSKDVETVRQWLAGHGSAPGPQGACPLAALQSGGLGPRRSPRKARAPHGVPGTAEQPSPPLSLRDTHSRTEGIPLRGTHNSRR